MKRLGVTGTQTGLSDLQWKRLRQLCLDDYAEFHHGDCIGVDAEVAGFIKEVRPDITIVAHPPENPSKRAFFESDVTMPEKGYLDRNKEIVYSVNKLWAFPKEMEEVMRSGTWATIRYARAARLPRLIIFPDGTIDNY